jgi:hypothetical protein
MHFLVFLACFTFCSDFLHGGMLGCNCVNVPLLNRFPFWLVAFFVACNCLIACLLVSCGRFSSSPLEVQFIGKVFVPVPGLPFSVDIQSDEFGVLFVTSLVLYSFTSEKGRLAD